MGVLYQEFYDWINIIEAYSKKNNGTAKIVKTPSWGQELDYFEASVEIKICNYSVNLRHSCVRTPHTMGYGFILIECEITDKKPFNLHITPLGFFEKLFNRNRFRTEIEELDKRFLTESSDHKLAYEIFKNSNLVDALISNSLFVFNIRTSRRDIFLKLKDMDCGPFNEEKCNNYISICKHVLEVFQKLPDKEIH